jgi:hypothetical protein
MCVSTAAGSLASTLRRIEAQVVSTTALERTGSATTRQLLRLRIKKGLKCDDGGEEQALHLPADLGLCLSRASTYRGIAVICF